MCYLQLFCSLLAIYEWHFFHLIQLNLKVLARFLYVFFQGFSSYLSFFTILMLAMDAEIQRIEPDTILYLFCTKLLEAVCKHDWHNVRSYLFFNMPKFRIRIWDSVCKDKDMFSENKS